MPSLINVGYTKRGFTILELLVSSSIAIGMLAICASFITTQRFVYKRSSVDTRLNQNLKGAMELVGSELREAGENLSGNFPAFEVINGASGAPDTLIIRRNLLDEVLNVCTSISSGSTATTIDVAIPGGVAGCVYSDQGHSYSTWQNYRVGNGGVVKAYAYDVVNKLGEYFDLTGGSDNGTTLSLTRSAGVWSRAYNVGAASLYILEEWRFSLNGDILELVENGDTGNPLKISYGLNDFQVQVKMQDGSTAASFSNTDRWADSSYLEVQMKSADSFQKSLRRAELVTRFMPRNILSN